MTGDREYERRKRTLTEEDIEAIVEASARACSGDCAHGVTEEEVHELRHFARMLMKIKMAIGNTVLYAVIAGIIVLFYMGASKVKGP